MSHHVTADIGRLGRVLDVDADQRRRDLDDRFAVLGDVIAGRRRTFVYPAARLGRAAAQRLKDIGVEVTGFGDRDSDLQGSVIDGLPVLSPVELSERHRDDPVLVASAMFDSAIREDLESRGCRHVVPFGYLNLRLPDIFAIREYDGAWDAAVNPRNRPDIESAFAVLADEESRRVFEGKLAFYADREKPHLDEIRSNAPIYFDPDVWRPSGEDVVVDGGAFIGDTLTAFRTASSDRFRTYVAFEPDVTNFRHLSLAAEEDPSRIEAVNAGLGRRAGQVNFLSTEGADARVLRVDEPSGVVVQIVTLDDYFDGRPTPTFIKLDIEGSEVDALDGALRVIAAGRPSMAISAYHYPTDLWTIPLLLARLAPSSRILLRHYTREVDDTVCYAIPELPSSGSG